MNDELWEQMPGLSLWKDDNWLNDWITDDLKRLEDAYRNFTTANSLAIDTTLIATSR